ncbi:MAG: hypothetical protein JO056_14010 [Alphaproteobacteria bacterium]|nr:hypothetical protein [Alphaproteobacteria bacterium]
MRFKSRNLRALAEMVIGDNDKFQYRSSSYITQFFQECDLDLIHNGSTRWAWTSDRLAELLSEPSEAPNTLPPRFVHVLRVLMQKGDATEKDPDRQIALAELNKPLSREGFEAFYGDDSHLYIRHIGTQTISVAISPHRPFTPDEIRKRESLSRFLDGCSEDDLIGEVLLPLFRQLGFQRISAAGHKDKALEYGKDVWMRFVLPTQHVLYFGMQAKKGKLDAAGSTHGSNSNVAEIHNQLLMMLGHEIFDPETSKKVLVDHAFIVAGGEITKQAKNWLDGKLDATRRSQILFMDREDILNLYVVSVLALPKSATPQTPLLDEIPF